jgi:hypothetical protein
VCRLTYAPGSHDLVIGMTECNDPSCPMRAANTVPLNRAAYKARRKAGLPDHPDGWKPGESTDDAVARQLQRLFGTP